MTLKTLLSSLAIITLLADVASAKDARNPLMDEDFFSDETTVALVQAELDKGAGLSDRSKYGENPLHFALKGHASVDVIKLLVEAGAPLNQPKGNKGNVAMLAAVAYGDAALLDYLRPRVANLPRWMTKAKARCSIWLAPSISIPPFWSFCWRRVVRAMIPCTKAAWAKPSPCGRPGLKRITLWNCWIRLLHWVPILLWLMPKDAMVLCQCVAQQELRSGGTLCGGQRRYHGPQHRRARCVVDGRAPDGCGTL